MEKYFYKFSEFFKDLIPFKFIRFLSGQNFILPFYHLVSDENPIHLKHLYPVKTTKTFEKELDFLLKYYNPISIVDLLKSVEREQTISKPAFLLSFDDGLREFNDVIAPVLLRKGIPATCFLNSAFIDNRDLFFRFKASILIEEIQKKQLSERVNKWFETKNLKFENLSKALLNIRFSNKNVLDELAGFLELDFNEFLQKEKPYLSSSQIESLTKQGFTFGAHSIDHPLYSEISIKEQLRQTKESVEYVFSAYKQSYKTFAFPYTDYNVSGGFFETIYKNEMLDLTFGCAGIKSENFPRHFQRIALEYESFSAQSIIKGQYLYFLAKAMVRKNTIKRV